jgi:2-isopropylmalate synthase
MPARRRNVGAPVVFFDTTLRDGEQAPGSSLHPREKLQIARQLGRLGVSVIEAGFPASSPGEFEAVRTIARRVRGPVITGLARCKEDDIRTCWEAVREAERPRIHTFLSTSDIHLEHQLRATREEVLALTRAMVATAVSLCPRDVQFSAMDATRSNVDFLAAVLGAAIECGATTVNISDTVGYALPAELADLIDRLYEKTAGLDKVVLSVHCHDDLGVATANTLAAIERGVTQVEVAVNGLGERAGVAALEEVAMALVTRDSVFQRPCAIVTTEIARTSEIVASLTGHAVPANKAVVGKNAFAHESGIHQDGVIKERSTYEIMRSEDVGRAGSAIVLGKHSGRHAVRLRLNELGLNVQGQELDEVCARLKDVARSNSEVSGAELLALAGASAERTDERTEGPRAGAGRTDRSPIGAGPQTRPLRQGRTK